jgi:hypothetical protein
MGYTISKLLNNITCDCFGGRSGKDDVDNKLSNNTKNKSYNYDFENIKNNELYTPIRYYVLRNDLIYNDI